MRGAHSIARTCAVKRSSSTKNAAGERVLGLPVTVAGLEAVTVSMVPASQNTQSTMQQRGLSVTHQITFPNGADVREEDVLEISGASYLVRSFAILPRALVVYVELTTGTRV